jgi:hypothetical protein
LTDSFQLPDRPEETEEAFRGNGASKAKRANVGQRVLRASACRATVACREYRASGANAGHRAIFRANGASEVRKAIQLLDPLAATEKTALTA